MLRRIFHVVSAGVSIVCGLVVGFECIRPLARWLGVNQYSEFRWYHTPELHPGLPSLNEVIVLACFVVISLVLQLSTLVLTSMICSCDDCNDALYTVSDVGISVYDYVSFPVRYIFDIPRELPYGQYWKVGDYHIRRGGRPQSITHNGDQHWSDVYGNPHRDNDRPAVIRSNGDRLWYRHGRLHRVGGPALITRHGYYYHQDGEIHRDHDEPAAITRDSYTWYIHGVCRRSDTELPSNIYPNAQYYEFTDETGTIYTPYCVKM